MTHLQQNADILVMLLACTFIQFWRKSATGFPRKMSQVLPQTSQQKVRVETCNVFFRATHNIYAIKF